MSHCSMIFFQSGRADIISARNALKSTSYPLEVTTKQDHLLVRSNGSPEFRVYISAEPHVRLEAAEIGEGTEFEAALSRWDAGFEISFAELDDTLDEMNTLIEIQATLQELTQGHIFISWNEEIPRSARE